MTVRHSHPVNVTIGPLVMGQVATINDTSDGLSNPQGVYYSIRHPVVQNGTFPQETTLCAQTKGVWTVTLRFITVRHEDKIKCLQVFDPENGGGAGPYVVQTEFLGIRNFWIESCRVEQVAGNDPENFSWDVVMVEDVSGPRNGGS
jgi:hypothetical protein